MGNIKSECLELLVLFGETSLLRTVAAYLEHNHGERNHQGLSNRLLAPDEHVGRDTGKVECREKIGGMLRYYYRAAA